MERIIFKTYNGHQFIADPNEEEHIAFFARYNQNPDEEHDTFMQLLEEDPNTAFALFIAG